MISDASVVVAVILAGHAPGEDDPLVAYSQGRPKGLIQIAGRPMIAYVLDALLGSRYIQRIVVVGLPTEDWPSLGAAVDYIAGCGDMVSNVTAGIEYALSMMPELDAVMIGSADLPLLTPEIVDYYIKACLETEHELYYSIIERAAMERRFPSSRRTYVRLADGEYAGGDLILMRKGMAMPDHPIWRRLAGARKSPIRQAWMLGGPWPLFKLVTHRMGLAEAERRATKALKVNARVVVSDWPEVGMDVDKPFQLEIARAELEARSSDAVA